MIDSDQFNAETILQDVLKKTSLLDGQRTTNSNDAFTQIKDDDELYHVIIVDLKSITSIKVSYT